MSCIEPDRNDRAIDIGQMDAILLHTAYDISATSYTLDAIWIDARMLVEARNVIDATIERLARSGKRFAHS